MSKFRWIQVVGLGGTLLLGGAYPGVSISQILPLGLLGSGGSLLMDTQLELDNLGVMDGELLGGLSLLGSGQDILLLGNPVSFANSSAMNSLPGLSDNSVADDAVSGFLQESEANGAVVEPEVQTIFLRQERLSGDPAAAEDACQDTDDDGICGDRDYCANTPAGKVVTEWGCHIEPGTVLPLHGVDFADDSALIKASSAEILRNLASLISQNPAAHRIVVYKRKMDEPKSLASYRAQSVVNFLIAEGVSDKYLEAKVEVVTSTSTAPSSRLELIQVGSSY